MVLPMSDTKLSGPVAAELLRAASFPSDVNAPELLHACHNVFELLRDGPLDFRALYELTWHLPRHLARALTVLERLKLVAKDRKAGTWRRLDS